MSPFYPVRLSVVAAAALVASSAFAQVKTDGQWRGAGGAALSMTSGNSSTTALALNADMVRATIEDKITLGANTNYGRSKNGAGISSTTANKWAAAGEYDYNLSPALFVFGKLGFEGDGLVDLSLRSTLAAGLGYKLIDTKETSFSVFGGVGYSTDQYDKSQTIGGKKGKTFSRSSLFLGEESSHQLSASTSFKQRLELYPGLSGDKAKIMKFTAGLTVAMSSTLNLSVGLVDNYNSVPAAGNKKNDLGLFTGINVKFGAL
jgi:putative salt-induced outer membrane protein